MRLVHVPLAELGSLVVVLAEMNADPEVMRFIGTGRMIERAETAAMVCGVGYLSFAPRASDVA